MKDILLVGATREASTRCKNKMIRKFFNTTLFDIYMEKLELISSEKHPFSDIVIALYEGDKTLWSKAQNFNVKIQKRNEFSAKHGKLLSDILHYLRDYREQYIMWINSSLPFLSVSTILEAANRFRKKTEIKSLHCVKRKYNWFWNNTNSSMPINVEDKSHTRTQDCLPIYESVHAFHIFDREFMLDNNAYWDFTENNPYLMEVPDDLEFMDINTEKDFVMCESLAAQGKLNFQSGKG